MNLLWMNPFSRLTLKGIQWWWNISRASPVMSYVSNSSNHLVAFIDLITSGVNHGGFSEQFVLPDFILSVFLFISKGLLLGAFHVLSVECHWVGSNLDALRWSCLSYILWYHEPIINEFFTQGWHWKGLNGDRNHLIFRPPYSCVRGQGRTHIQGLEFIFSHWMSYKLSEKMSPPPFQ